MVKSYFPIKNNIYIFLIHTLFFKLIEIREVVRMYDKPNDYSINRKNIYLKLVIFLQFGQYVYQHGLSVRCEFIIF